MRGFCNFSSSSDIKKIDTRNRIFTANKYRGGALLDFYRAYHHELLRRLRALLCNCPFWGGVAGVPMSSGIWIRLVYPHRAEPHYSADA